MNKKKLIFICTANSCRSQMAEGFLKEMASDIFDVYSAGSHPTKIHPLAIKVMREVGIDISYQTSKPISLLINEGMNFVLTVCEAANKACPVFPGKVEQIHWNIKDPLKDWNSNFEDLLKFRMTRNEIRKKIEEFLKSR